MKRLQLTHQSIHSGNLILVNAQTPLIEQVEKPSLIPVNQLGEPILLARSAANVLRILMEGLNGWEHMCAVSGWRSKEAQKAIYEQSLLDHGADFTRQFVALPGHSEHQTGLAIDLGEAQGELDFICPSFPYTGICQAFRKKAVDFGFIERYPAGKESVTGIAHEPWHFRYVGAPHAAIMTELGLTLEEYLLWIKQYPQKNDGFFYSTVRERMSVSYVKANAEGETSVDLDENVPYVISGNNVDGFIVTQWRERYET